jgi:hypothetical protein
LSERGSRLRLALALAALAAVGCRNLAEVRANVCGNRVVEEGETCDGVPADSCLPPGAAGECHFDCSLAIDGTRQACPAGSGCDIGGVCREATGNYVATNTRITDNATSVIAADFDGDGRADVMSQESLSVLSGSKFRLNFFGRDGAPSQRWISARPVISLAVGQVSDDARADVVFADARVGLLLGQPDRTLISDTYSSYFLPNIRIRVAGPVSTAVLDDSVALLILAESPDGLELRRPDSGTASLLPIASVPAEHVSDLAGELVEGDLFAGDASDPCVDTAMALRGASEARVFSVCKVDAETGAPVWREGAVEHVVPLVPPTPITSGPMIGDVNGDGHLDLVVGTEHQAYVAYGNGRELAAAQPWEARTNGGDSLAPISMPLALGDYTGDGPVDLVYPGGFLVSQRALDGTLEYRNVGRGFGELWTAARVADLNGNGKLDVIAISDTKLDIEFWNGTGTTSLNPAVIPTQRPVRELVVGDFDGDLIQDLAYTQIVPPAEPTEVLVSFGTPAGVPMPGVTAARASGVMQIGALDYDPQSQASELFIAYLQTDAQGVEGSAFAWLTGFDRHLICLVELTTFSEDGSIGSMFALSVALGAFTKPGQRDALVLATYDLASDDVGLWLVPDLRNRTDQPRTLGWTLDPDVKPLRGSNPTGSELDVLMAAGDLDGDGIDELAIAAPSADREHCRVSIARVSAADAEFELQSSEPLSLEAPCRRSGQLVLEDLDGDSARDLVLLLGGPDEAHTIVVFWNDGEGNFSEEASMNLLQGDDDPEAFVLYRPTPGDRLRFAYVTHTRLHVLRANQHGRGFDSASDVTSDIELEHATGVTAGDVDGDGIADLIVADSGDVVVFRAQLQP